MNVFTISYLMNYSSFFNAGQASKIPYQHTVMVDTAKQVEALDATRVLVSDAQLSQCFPYSSEYLTWETNRVKLPETFITLGISSLAYTYINAVFHLTCLSMSLVGICFSISHVLTCLSSVLRYLSISPVLTYRRISTVYMCLSISVIITYLSISDVLLSLGSSGISIVKYFRI